MIVCVNSLQETSLEYLLFIICLRLNIIFLSFNIICLSLYIICLSLYIICLSLYISIIFSKKQVHVYICLTFPTIR